MLIELKDVVEAIGLTILGTAILVLFFVCVGIAVMHGVLVFVTNDWRQCIVYTCRFAVSSIAATVLYMLIKYIGEHN